MSILVNNSYSIPLDTRQIIAKRYHIITKAINKEYWNSINDSSHSFYVGSYGRGTAISTSDIDILVELPSAEYDKFSSTIGNEQSRLLQAIRNSIKDTYSSSDIRADGQVVKINFHDGIKFEILPSFKKINYFENTETYIYPDTNMGGNWKSTNPKMEQQAMKNKNKTSNDLLYATCKHFRYIRDNYFSSYQLPGIVIDSFAYSAIGAWHYVGQDDTSSTVAIAGDYENSLLTYFNNNKLLGFINLYSPGSNQHVDTFDNIDCLEKVIKKIAL